MSPNEIKLELDGPGVQPATVDARELLTLAAALLDLMQNIAKDGDRDLKFVGLQIIDKCAAIVTRANDAAVAEMASLQASQYIGGELLAPHGLTGLVHRARESLTNLGAGRSASMIVADKIRPLRVPKPIPVDFPDSIVSLRVEVVRVGGAGQPRATFKSELETRPFTLGLSKAAAEKMARYLYKELDVEAEVVRAADGSIERGRIISFHPLSAEEPIEAFDAWYERIGRPFAGGNDPLRERSDERD